MMKLSIIDDDGIIAIVNSANYQTFVDEDWSFEQLTNHFANQTKAGNLIIWQTSNDGGGNWTVSVQDHPSETHAYRQFDQFINVTSGELFLTNYSDLTMAAQFANIPIPAVHHNDLNVKLENGWYKFTVRQLFDPDNSSDYFDIDDAENTAFEIIFVPATKPVSIGFKGIYWTEN